MGEYEDYSYDQLAEQLTSDHYEGQHPDYDESECPVCQAYREDLPELRS